MPDVANPLIEHYEQNGYVTVDALLTTDELETLCRRTIEIAEGCVPAFPAENIEFEPGANGAGNASAVRKINRCAEDDDVFLALATQSRILDIVESLIGPDIKLFGSQCFMKPAGGVEKPYHQDSAYFTIEPPELVTCWTALDDTTTENGCLWIIPGSHREGLLDHDQPWQVGDRVDQQVRAEQIDLGRETPIEMKAGSCSFHHSMLLHRSGANQTQNSRRGMAVHYMSAHSRWTHPTKAKPNYRLLRGQEHDGCV